MRDTDAQRALSFFDPILIELVREGKARHEFEAEGFTHFEVSAVRALVGLTRTQTDVLAGDALRAKAGSNARAYRH